MSLKLSQLKRADTARIELRNPADNTLTGAGVIVYGPTSDQFREATDAMRGRQAALYRRFKDDDKIPSAEALNVRKQYLADITADWFGFKDDADNDLPYSRAGALELYGDPDIALQVTTEIAVAANFMKG